MQSTQERKKHLHRKSLLPSFNSDLKKYDDIYNIYCTSGYSKELAELFSASFVNEVKKPLPEDIIFTAELYDRIYDNKTAMHYLKMLSVRRLNGDEKFDYCVLKLKTLSKLGKFHEAESFRTENIDFMQTYAEKTTPQKKTSLYIALALVDCSAKNYTQAFKMLKSAGYKPIGKQDETLLKILITGVYIYACSEDSIVSEAVSASVKSEEDSNFFYDKPYYDNLIKEAVKNLEVAVANAKSGIKIVGEFEFEWCRNYYEDRIKKAFQKII